MRDVKGDSSLWINENKFIAGRFSWQEGYGAFSYSKSQIPAVATYIQNQELHHQKITFIEEYRKMLHDFGIDFNEQFIFKSINE
jgi:hypothetical protein